VGAGRTLTLGSGFTFGNTNGVLAGVGTLDLSAALEVFNSGTIAPGNSIGTLTVNAALIDQETSSLIDIEIDNTGSHDVLVVNGTFDVDGTLKLDFLPTATLSDGDSFTVISYTDKTGQAQFDSVTHDLPPGFFISSVDYGSTSITVTITQLYSAVFDAGGGSADWATPANWVGDVLPISSDDVLIDSWTVEHSTGTTMINSLTLEGPAYFILSGGSLALTSASNFGPSSTATVSSTLTVDSSLNLEGTVYFESGSIEGVGTINNLGTFYNSTAFKTIDPVLVNDGDFILSDGGGTSAQVSMGDLTNNGTIEFIDAGGSPGAHTLRDSSARLAGLGGRALNQLSWGRLLGNRTTHAVARMIFRSSQSDWWSWYHSSSSPL